MIQNPSQDWSKKHFLDRRKKRRNTREKRAENFKNIKRLVNSIQNSDVRYFKGKNLLKASPSPPLLIAKGFFFKKLSRLNRTR